jgi:hypothetical protein
MIKLFKKIFRRDRNKRDQWIIIMPGKVVISDNANWICNKITVEFNPPVSRQKILDGLLRLAPPNTAIRLKVVKHE